VSRRRWGYVVWGVALGFVFVPEILAAIPFTESQLPFPTISATMGHLEYEHAEWTLLPTTLIGHVLYTLWRAPAGAKRTPGGRLTFKAQAAPPSYDNEVVRDVWFALRSLAIAIVVAGGTLLAYHYWPNEYVVRNGMRAKLPNYRVAYVLYGSIGLFWIALPTIQSLVSGRDAEFPTLIRTVRSLEQWVDDHVGQAAGWFLSFVLVWGMVFLLLHLTFYPFPNITRILNPNG